MTQVTKKWLQRAQATFSIQSSKKSLKYPNISVELKCNNFHARKDGGNFPRNENPDQLIPGRFFLKT